eukprot:CAMPEP_0198311406 /NCGR_PEP_ID=MMETSP1450-20131203/3139_1 /TAXON_ID=753684 ORGANISM="Madagascaria erythrocladiodes, Strain CCMP3234" /NCGR_SAMPLE_ID=MMETSP1450 /ASSEMBLY_ACC=CAM_ASM_001115 /LENGTH=78 /DNA_ID=CAMNT_0044014281 /DNA_START=39 /DNA_END=275 /DNA_ORIENTATION=-
MSKGGPDLKKYMDKRVAIGLNAKRKVQGTLRGYDQFMNVVLEDAVEPGSTSDAPAAPVGMVVIRGNSIVSIEPLEFVR